MTETDSWRNELEPSVADEVRLIVDAFAAREKGEGRTGSGKRGGGRRGGKGGGGKDGESPIVPVMDEEDHRLDYMYAEGQLLVREEYLGRVLDILEHPDEATLRRREPAQIRPVIAGVVLLTLDRTAELTAPLAAQRVDDALGRGIATPNHVLTVAGNTGGCPATEPEEVYAGIEPYPSVCQDNGGEGVLIYMADTGLLAHPEHGHPWLAGVRPGDPADVDTGDGQDPIPPYTGSWHVRRWGDAMHGPRRRDHRDQRLRDRGQHAGSGSGAPAGARAPPGRGHLPPDDRRTDQA